VATPSEKLAQSLEELRNLQSQGRIAIRSSDLSRIHRERLCTNGFLQEVMKGWYIPSRPDDTRGESTAWYACFWSFCAAYLKERFGDDWSLSPEQSLSLQVGNRTVPKQLMVRSSKARNKVTELIYGTSLLEVRAIMPDRQDVVEMEGLRLFSLPAALIASSPSFFRQNPTDARAALSTIRDASDVLNRLLEGGHTTIAGRLAGAFRNIGRDRIADDILKAMRAADYNSYEQDPFEQASPTLLTGRETSPYVNRIRLMWQEMREPILNVFPKPPGLPKDGKAYLEQVEEVYVTDAYHSLSIEGYRVSPELIEKVRSGDWNPDTSEADREHRSALAARGYWEAFQEVKGSIEKILTGKNAGQVADEDHGNWYRKLFAPSVAAGILRPGDLAGYRNDQVYIRRSMHVPPSKEAVRELMPAFLELLQEEDEPAVRVVLGHFVFVYIHPYMDGNGRIGRFLMNAMLASGGYPWTVIPVEQRDAYLAALEEASVNQNITDFAQFLGKLVEAEL
jgi:fido (protein-threonine AMPylation protein)